MTTEIRYKSDGSKEIGETARVHSSGTLYGAPVMQSRCCGPIMTLLQNRPRLLGGVSGKTTRFDQDMTNRR